MRPHALFFKAASRRLVCAAGSRNHLLPLAFALGLVAVAGIQLLYMGTGFTLLPCRALAGLFGEAMIGIGPLMLAYLIVAALTNSLALGPEG